ncbi:hypothetical protein J3F84DRAFT_361487 [Trichoderma pleuroticola]
MRVRLILKLLQWDADYLGCNVLLLYWGFFRASSLARFNAICRSPASYMYIHTRTAAADERLVIAGPSTYMYHMYADMTLYLEGDFSRQRGSIQVPRMTGEEDMVLTWTEPVQRVLMYASRHIRSIFGHTKYNMIGCGAFPPSNQFKHRNPSVRARNINRPILPSLDGHMSGTQPKCRLLAPHIICGYMAAVSAHGSCLSA